MSADLVVPSLDAVTQDADSLAAQVKDATTEMLNLNLSAYAGSKKNWRQEEIEQEGNRNEDP